MSTLLVASTGGHLKQLTRLAPRMPDIRDGVTWFTHSDRPERSDCSREQDVIDAHPTEIARLRGDRPQHAAGDTVVKRNRFSRVVSTGSGIALSIMPIARIAASRATT